MEDPDQLTEQVGRKIAELRASAGLTQAEVAKRLDMAVNNYQRIEHGQQNVTLRTMVRIAGVVGVRVARLLEAPVSNPKKALRGRPKGS